MAGLDLNPREQVVIIGDELLEHGGVLGDEVDVLVPGQKACTGCGAS